MKSLGEEFKERKNELGITTEQLSRLSGIPTGTHQQDSEWRDKISTLCNIEGTE